MSSYENFISDILVRLTGPLSFRFILQPIIAILLGIRDGRLDAKAKNPPFVIDLLAHPETRNQKLIKTFTMLITPIIVGILTDLLSQYLLFRSVVLYQAVLVGLFVISFPYSISRGLTNRIIFHNKNQTNQKQFTAHPKR
jgi:hypothetical protein